MTTIQSKETHYKLCANIASDRIEEEKEGDCRCPTKILNNKQCTKMKNDDESGNDCLLLMFLKLIHIICVPFLLLFSTRW